MPLYRPYETRYKQQYTNIVDCLAASVPIQTQSGGTNWFPEEYLTSISLGNNPNGGAIKSDGTLWLWGDNTAGTLGNGDETNRCSPVQTIATGSNWCQLSSGGQFTAAVKTDGTLWIWGRNSDGNLGNNSAGTNESSPIQTICTGNNWKQVALSRNQGGAVDRRHGIALKKDGTLWAWGYNANGQLGLNDNVNRRTPVQVIGSSTDWTQIATACEASFGLKTDGTLWSWGLNQRGVLGDGTLLSKCSPVQVVGAATNWRFVAGGFEHAGAIKTDGTLWMWGRNASGVLGNFLGTNNQSSPAQTVATGTNWKQLSLGNDQSAAIKTDGTLWLWGTDASGVLGNNSDGDGYTAILYSSPVQTITTGSNWKQVAAGASYTGAIKTDGTLWMWGSGNTGRLGNGLATNRSSPIQTISAVTTWTCLGPEDPIYSVSLGSDHSAVIKTDGTLWLWGFNNVGQLGNNLTITQSSPVQTITTGSNWKQVSLGINSNHSSAIKTDGTLWLWGRNDSGQLGNNSTIDVSSPVQTVSTGTNWKQVSLGNLTSAALKTDGTLWLWGWNPQGQLGNNLTINQSSPVQTVSTGTNWKQVSLGTDHSSAIKTDGTLWLWGVGTNGRLGTNTTTNRCSPVQTVSTGSNWQQVSLGNSHSAAIKTDGTLWIWGNGEFGRLGNNSTADVSSPVQAVTTGTNWKQVSLGSCHSASIKTDGTLWLWGDNQSGKLGNNSTINRSSPVQTACTGIFWKELPDHQGGFHSAAISSDNRLYIWGNNSGGQLGCNLQDGSQINTDLGNILVDKDYLLEVYQNLVPQIKAPALWIWGRNQTGQLGDNTTANKSSPVQTISRGLNWNILQSGSYQNSSAAIKSDGTLWLWGKNDFGQLGNENTVDTSSPIQAITTGTNWKQVSLSQTHSAAIKTDGTLWTWGRNANGQLGNNGAADVSSPVQTVSTGTNWKQVATGNLHSAAVKCDGTLWLWGSNTFGESGNNASADVLSPVQTVSTGTNWKQVSLGDQYSGAVKTDGTLWLWGDASCGRLGNNSTADVSSPVQAVTTGTNWKQVSLQKDNTGAIKTDGTLWLWGRNHCGYLGDNTTTDKSSPVQTIATGNNWKKVSIGCHVSAALKIDGTLWLWGCGKNGSLGNNNDTVDVSSPVQTIVAGNDWKQVSAGAGHILALRETYEW